MNVRQLRIFQCVCEEGNITKAAQKLFMTQPAISHAIHDLETEIGTILFDRVGKRIYINEVGALFSQRVESVLQSFEALEHGIPLLEEEANLRIGSSITIANYWLPKALANFQNQYPRTPIEVWVDSAQKIVNKLLQHEIDIALVEGVVNDDRLVCNTFDSYELLFVCSSSSPFANKKEIQWEDIAKQNWLLREVGSATRDTFDSALRLQQIAIQPYWTSVNSQALLQGVKQGLGMSVLPDKILMHRDLENLTALRIEGTTLRNETHIVYRKGTYLTKSLQNFIKIMK